MPKFFEKYYMNRLDAIKLGRRNFQGAYLRRTTPATTLFPSFPAHPAPAFRSSPDAESEYWTVKGPRVHDPTQTTPFSSRNFSVTESVFEFIPESRMSSLNPLGPRGQMPDYQEAWIRTRSPESRPPWDTSRRSCEAFLLGAFFKKEGELLL